MPAGLDFDTLVSLTRLETSMRLLPRIASLGSGQTPASSAARILVWLHLISLVSPAATALGERPADKRMASCVADWPQFLGPRRDGVSHEQGLNFDWLGQPPKILWRKPLGSGFSSLSIVGNRLFTMSQQGDQIVVVCFGASTGEQLWTQPLGSSYLDNQNQGPGPRATPTYGRGKLFCLGPSGELACLNANDGEISWRTNVYKASSVTDPSDEDLYWGLSGSPLVVDDLVICLPGGGNNNSIAAFDKHSGKLIWTVGSDHRSYASPITATLDGRRQIVCYTGESLLGLDPARGSILWRFAFQNQHKCTCATPLVIDDQIFISTAYGAGSALVQLELRNGKFDVQQKWAQKRFQTLFATSVIVDGYAYGCHGDTSVCTLRCLELATGQLKWIARPPGRCTLIAAEGHIIALSEDGVLRLVAANSTQYIEKGRLDGLLTYKAWATPALSQGRLYARDQQDLVCVDLRE